MYIKKLMVFENDCTWNPLYGKGIQLLCYYYVLSFQPFMIWWQFHAQGFFFCKKTQLLIHIITKNTDFSVLSKCKPAIAYFVQLDVVVSR